MNAWASIGAGVAALLVGAIAFGLVAQRHAAGEAERAYSELIAQIAGGNHFGTPDYLPFLQARIKRAKYR